MVKFSRDRFKVVLEIAEIGSLNNLYIFCTNSVTLADYDTLRNSCACKTRVMDVGGTGGTGEHGGTSDERGGVRRLHEGDDTRTAIGREMDECMFVVVPPSEFITYSPQTPVHFT